ncbi:hypothetical protein SDC9_160078 [bioreactor metagenome]|uniref:Uncharacterized protein n=1 Tax=bioreactor metagenome TaxID=1076179 RepID=A0A645FED7_9ZZZZ
MLIGSDKKRGRADQPIHIQFGRHMNPAVDAQINIVRRTCHSGRADRDAVFLQTLQEGQRAEGSLGPAAEEQFVRSNAQISENGAGGNEHIEACLNGAFPNQPAVRLAGDSFADVIRRDHDGTAAGKPRNSQSGFSGFFNKGRHFVAGKNGPVLIRNDIQLFRRDLRNGNQAGDDDRTVVVLGNHRFVNDLVELDRIFGGRIFDREVREFSQFGSQDFIQAFNGIFSEIPVTDVSADLLEIFHFAV